MARADASPFPDFVDVSMSFPDNVAIPNARFRFTAPWRLRFYRDEFGNFGDDLNSWLWPRLLPGLLDDTANSMLVGIGTILTSELPSGPKVIVGSGVGYGSVPRLDDSWAVHFVRGPVTARALGLPESYAITDPAHLITQLVRPVANGAGTIYIPHPTSRTTSVRSEPTGEPWQPRPACATSTRRPR